MGIRWYDYRMELQPDGNERSESMLANPQKLAQFMTYMALRADHQRRLESTGILDKAISSLTPYDRLMISGAIVEPVVYAKPITAAPHPRLSYIGQAIDEGVCLVARKIDAYQKLDTLPAWANCGHAEDSLLWPRQDKVVSYSNEEFAAVHEMVEQVRDAQRQERIPALSNNLTMLAEI